MIVIFERISGDIAIFESEQGSTLEIHRSELPPDLHVGQVYKIHFTADPNLRAELITRLHDQEAATRQPPSTTGK